MDKQTKEIQTTLSGDKSLKEGVCDA